MTSGSDEGPAQQVLEEAAAWLSEFVEGEVEFSARRRFNRWIRRSPEHIRAFLELSVAWEVSSSFDHSRSFDPHELIRNATMETNVHQLRPLGPEPGLASPEGPIQGGGTADPPVLPKASHSPRMLRFGAAAAVLALMGVVIYFARQTNSYSTELGEQRSILLSDGSSMLLNSSSTVRIDFSSHERAVELASGEAIFDVARDAARPFIVRSGLSRIRAIGTRFDVYRRAVDTLVTVIDGRVSLSLAPDARLLSKISSRGETNQSVNSASGQLTLGPGQTATISLHSFSKPASIDPAAATAWTQRRIVFEDAPLGDVVAEFNRYNTKRLVIEDESLNQYHVRGTFLALHPQVLARFLEQRFGLSAVETATEIRISRSRTPPPEESSN